MIAVLLRFLLLGVVMAFFTAIAAYVLLRWILPVTMRGWIEENKAYRDWCRAFRVAPRAKTTETKGKKKTKIR
jgi:hypothetical protein